MTTVSVVVATRNRRPELLRTLGELRRLPERPPVVVVDNESSDGTVAGVGDRFPDVVVVVASAPLGPAARNLGVARTATPYVAFSDDDSWWAPGSLSLAADLFDRHPRLGLVTGRVLVGPDRRLDPMSAVMAKSPLARGEDAPGVPVMGSSGARASSGGRPSRRSAASTPAPASEARRRCSPPTCAAPAGRWPTSTTSSPSTTRRRYGTPPGAGPRSCGTACCWLGSGSRPVPPYGSRATRWPPPSAPGAGLWRPSSPGTRPRPCCGSGPSPHPTCSATWPWSMSSRRGP